jgi:hypothetical protein
MRRIVSPMNKAQIDIFQGSHYEELGDDIPYISSKQQLSDECQKRGLVSRHLEEGFNAKRPARWL